MSVIQATDLFDRKRWIPFHQDPGEHPDPVLQHSTIMLIMDFDSGHTAAGTASLHDKATQFFVVYHGHPPLGHRLHLPRQIITGGGHD